MPKLKQDKKICKTCKFRSVNQLRKLYNEEPINYCDNVTAYKGDVNYYMQYIKLNFCCECWKQRGKGE